MRHMRVSALLALWTAREGMRSGERMENYPSNGASSGLIHSVALRLYVGPKSIRSLAHAVLSEVIRSSRSSNILISEEQCTEVGISI